jgi:mannosyl-oligosaccharide alpha-1,2-mannosidase
MYRQLYLNTIEAIRKYMLFRPMVPGSRDILFAGSFVTDGRLETPGVFTAEIDHLTCFIGGMVGMAAKIFDIENDLDIAKKLADGCVWAYGSMPSDIMAESAVLMPCESMENCVWNETAYHNFLDPSGADRDRRVEEYLAKKAAEKEDNERKAAEKEAKDLAEAAKGMDETAAKGMDETVAKGTDEIAAKGTDETAAEGAGKAAAKIKDQSAAKIQADSEKPKDEARRISNPTVPSLQKRAPPPRAGAADPQKPLSHKEWVQDHIQAYGLPAGYVNVKSKSYILR